MILELLFLGLLVFGLCVLGYRGAVHEFQILQKDFDTNTDDWSDLLSEQLPLVIRSIPKTWLGGWTRKQTEKKSWQIFVRMNGKKLKTTWTNWIQTPSPRAFPENMQEIAQVARLNHSFSNWSADGFRRWFWLPTQTPEPFILHGNDFLGVHAVTEESVTIVATDGAPIELWLAHEGAIPSNVSEDLLGKNPWIQTTEDIPWIGEVKFIEIKLRPGNAVVVPCHWWYAIRSAEENEDSWFWKGAFHSPISYLATKMSKPQIISS